ncbi:TetR/AcrR family transcriptional regulator [Gordonia crocea]|uniref:TetR family transcriptional regulator n=1 Tax=Gordonia crocea TaxID=589162 RepID=A0A7I9UW26_9ACTN|nr:TetR/AcrR family transcriptional regulator [Gordonia crocea]GED97414.1 TetR family transcriptional regulator [Gordonia crocea]
MSPAARREQFIALGRDLVKKVAIDNVSIEAVAQAAGVSRALVFHYFSSKQDFHVALAQAQADELLAVTAPDDSLGEAVDVLRSSMSGFLDFISEHRHAYTTFLRGTGSGDPQMRRVADDTRTVIADRILDRTQVFGIDRTPAVELAVRGWIAFVEETALTWLDGSEMPRDEVLDLIVESLFAIGSVVSAQPVDPVAPVPRLRWDGAPNR